MFKTNFSGRNKIWGGTAPDFPPARGYGFAQSYEKSKDVWRAWSKISPVCCSDTMHSHKRSRRL